MEIKVCLYLWKRSPKDGVSFTLSIYRTVQTLLIIKKGVSCVGY